jgi:thiamine pyrophosphate-dependent acetolactate synthase large subunit-like protein
MRPMLYLLANARNKAVLAIRQIIEIDATETTAIRAAQAEVRLYGDMMDAAREMMSRGREADSELNDEDRQALADYLNTDEAREAGINQAED